MVPHVMVLRGVMLTFNLPMKSVAGQRWIRGRIDKAICLFTYCIAHLCMDYTCHLLSASYTLGTWTQMFMHWFGLEMVIRYFRNTECNYFSFESVMEAPVFP